MMDLIKSYDFFKPEMLKSRVHVIGCGSVGSVVAENLVRFGITQITLYDFDVVESRNIANQLFRQADINRPKVEALADILCEINPDCKEGLILAPEGWKGQRLSGYVFLCVDNIDLRREIAIKFKDNKYIKAMFDFRTRLTDAQHYAADWGNKAMVDTFIASMAFSHDEAKAATPVSACNVELSVAPTIRVIVGLGVANFINFAKGGPIKKMILADAFNFTLDAF